MFIFPVHQATSRIGNLTRLIHTLAICDDHTHIHTILCGIKQQQYYLVQRNQVQTISDERFPMKILAEMGAISAKILVENHSSEMIFSPERKKAISDEKKRQHKKRYNGIFLSIHF